MEAIIGSAMAIRKFVLKVKKFESTSYLMTIVILISEI